MNFVENNGKKVAAILCVASAFPVVATVVAAKEEPGWHGDRYVNEDKTVAKGWQEIEGKSYYFSENGTVNSSKTEKATTASVSSNITGEVKETVATASQEAVKEVVEEKAAEVFAKYGAKEIRTPIFEATELFARGVGDTTDIVNKEMYTFEKSERSLTLRPENTAGVVRSFIENGMHRLSAPVKLWYKGPMFRYERPQAGRQRQFHQVGVEVIVN